MARHITVSGSAEIQAAPDIAVVTLGVERMATRASEARTGAAEAASRLLAVLREAGVEGKDIQTANITLQPQYDYNSGDGRTLRGYNASNSIAVTLRDLARSGEVVDAALEATGDAARMNGIRFGFANPATLLERARRAAVADARWRAETFANAAGVALGEVLQIAEVPDTSGRPSPKGMLEARALATPIEGGEESVSATVIVKFALERKAARKKRG